ncbi:hypothetical protein IKE79_00280 [Candidatus Saccharibacteria bacterium]|nr:hypothetical protein [Candidatus Saccharibacteria bacterium]
MHIKKGEIKLYPQIYESKSGGETFREALAYANLNAALPGKISALIHPEPSVWLPSHSSETYVWRVRLEVERDDCLVSPHYILDFGENAGHLGDGEEFESRCDFAIKSNYRELVTKVNGSIFNLESNEKQFYFNDLSVVPGVIRVYVTADRFAEQQQDLHRVAVISIADYARGVQNELPNRTIQLDESIFRRPSVT